MNRLVFTDRPLVMGIVNVTPDSFSGDGLLRGDDFVAHAINQAEQMLADGADILDIGGESSRPGATSIGADIEIQRVIPVIQAIRKKLGRAPILSVDTIKAKVAEAALLVGADMVNDISALHHDPDMAHVVARQKSSVVLMHNRAVPHDVQVDARVGNQYGAAVYDDIVEDVKRDLVRAAEDAKQAGIAADKIILDPGLGFGKTAQQNLALVRHISSIKDLGFPVLMGPSRKSFIGQTLDVPIDERLEGTAATVAISAFFGANIIRVHDVKFMARVVKMTTAIKHQ